MNKKKMDILKLINKIILCIVIFNVGICIAKVRHKNVSKSLRHININHIKNEVNQINKTKMTKVDSYEKSRRINKTQFFNHNTLYKITENFSDGSDNIFTKNYYFKRGHLIFYEKHTYFFEDGVMKGYDLNKSKHSIKKIYFLNNKVEKIEIKGNPKVFTKEEEYNYIKKDLENFIHISKLFRLPKYRSYKGGEEGFFDEYSLSGREKILKLTYEFKNSPCKITILDEDYNELIDIKKSVTKGKIEKKIKLNQDIIKNNKAGIKVYLDGIPGCKWWFKIEFEGEQIKIG
ncbi:MAG: hypothetical protein GY817_05580 [bacterium]|nr:hypothetical protein [bacterium]